MKEEKLIVELATDLFNFYFNEKSENEIYDSYSGFTIEKESKGNLSLKETIFVLLRSYVAYLVQRSSISRDGNFYEKAKELFMHGETITDPNLSLLASCSYGLIEYRNGNYILSKHIFSVLNQFRYNPNLRREMKSLPTVRIKKED